MFLYSLPADTLWCGMGNIASGPDQLGPLKSTDACCRTHDMCSDIIEAHKTKHGLTNPAYYTRFFLNVVLILRAFAGILSSAKPAASMLNQREVSFRGRRSKLIPLPRSDVVSRTGCTIFLRYCTQRDCNVGFQA